MIPVSDTDHPRDDIPSCPVCDSTAGELLALRVAPSGDSYDDPEMEAMGRERSFARCNNCGVLFDPRVRGQKEDSRR